MKWIKMNQTGIVASMMAASIVVAVIVIGCNENYQVIGTVSPIAVVPITANQADDDDDDDMEDKYKSKEPLPDPNDLIKDWDKPLFALFVSGRQHGYIEPCGCTGLDRQKGGLMRRHTVQQLLKNRGWDLVSIDAGNQIKRFGQQPAIKLRHTYDILCNVMNYDAIGFGVDDLKTPTIDLLQTIANVVGSSNPFVSANVDIMGAEMQKPFHIIERGGKKIGVTHVVCDEHIEKLKTNSDLNLKGAAEGLDAVVPQLQAEHCDLNVLVFQTPEMDEALQFARRYPIFDVMIATVSAGEPTMLPEMIKVGDHTTQLIQVGIKGMFVGVIGYYENDGKKELKYERVPLDARFKDSKQVEQVFAAYQNELEQLYVTGNLKDIVPKPHSSGYTFVGSEACMECHDDEFEIWENGVDGDGGPHFKATESLVHPPNSRGNIPRNFDPECLSCHVTGWNPQGFYPYQTGYIDLKKDKALHSNGCENCHGPGSEHVKLETLKNKNRPVDDELLKKLRNEVRLSVEDAEEKQCKQCHDLDNSPDFLKEGAFDEYWEKIEH